jgi:A/G-specific adenine glycosylase
MARWSAALLRWFAANRRAMPWRDAPTPYAVWISEVMLQQTRVATVIPYFHRFKRRFPTVTSLARARESDVLKAWEGLGYYSRARNLLRTARIVVAEHGGRLPPDLAALRGLPGIGDYSAAAIASIAFGIPAPAVDGNVARVLARLWAVAGDVRAPRARRALADRLRPAIPASAAGDFTQALMELGSMVCRPRDPLCSACPLAPGCLARRRGLVGRLPVRRATRRPPLRREVAAIVRRDARTAMVRRTPGGLLGGFWELPTAIPRRRERVEEAAVRAAAGAGLVVHPVHAIPPLDHAFTHFRLRLIPVVCAPVSVVSKGATWLTASQIRARPVSTSHRRALAGASLIH